jgi:hypothetical protein
MLAQLVCVDRRYQRMNCFNIREIQSLLKRRFFVDLINPHDHKNLLHKTMVNLKFKTNDEQITHPNLFIFYNYGLEFAPKTRNLIFLNITNNIKTYFNSTSFFVSILHLVKNFTIFEYLNNFL